jgi:hypothetical protein
VRSSEGKHSKIFEINLSTFPRRLNATVRLLKARLEAQRGEAAGFVMPQLVGLNVDDVEFRSVYSAENDTFLRLVAAYQSELKVLQQQRPRIEDEIHAVTDQIANLITRTRQSGTVAFNATADTKLEPGDVIEVKLNRRDPTDSPATEAALNRQKAPAAKVLRLANRLETTQGQLQPLGQVWGAALPCCSRRPSRQGQRSLHWGKRHGENSWLVALT